MKNIKITRILILTFFTIIFNNCNNDDSSKLNINPDTINLEDTKLSNFPLFAITPVSLEIIDPIIVNNEETEFGKINIIVSNTISLDGIASAITSNELNLSKFGILPGNNTMLNYETESHVHTIVNVFDESQELLHYTVNIEQETTPTLTTLTVTDFKFEASKNTQLTADVTIEKRFDNPNNQIQDIYLFVPAGTDFSDLTPTATFDAEAVFYTQNSSTSIDDIDTPYPTTETNFDFAYPQSFIIVLRDEATDRTKWVNVFVDVKNPVELENSDVTTQNVITPGSTEYFTSITRWKNIGNHPIEFQSATTYENKVPDVNVITADRNLVTGGLIPMESANVNVQISGNLPVGEYKATAVFYTGFYSHDAVNDLVEPVKLNITANVVN